MKLKRSPISFLLACFSLVSFALGIYEIISKDSLFGIILLLYSAISVIAFCFEVLDPVIILIMEIKRILIRDIPEVECRGADATIRTAISMMIDEAKKLNRLVKQPINNSIVVVGADSKLDRLEKEVISLGRKKEDNLLGKPIIGP